VLSKTVCPCLQATASCAAAIGQLPHRHMPAGHHSLATRPLSASSVARGTGSPPHARFLRARSPLSFHPRPRAHRNSVPVHAHHSRRRFHDKWTRGVLGDAKPCFSPARERHPPPRRGGSLRQAKFGHLVPSGNRLPASTACVFRGLGSQVRAAGRSAVRRTATTGGRCRQRARDDPPAPARRSGHRLLFRTESCVKLR